MKRNIAMLVTALAALAITIPVFAQEPAAAPAGGAAAEAAKWVIITAGFAMAIASAVCGYAQSKAIAAACEALARNPGARPGIQLAWLLGLIFIESLALYTLAIIAVKVK